MILALPLDVRERLYRIDAEEGVPALEVAHQAISILSQLDAGERRSLGQVAIGMAMERVTTADKDRAGEVTLPASHDPRSPSKPAFGFVESGHRVTLH